MNLKIPGTIFLLIPFFKYQKKHTYESQNTWHNFFPHSLFQILIKAYLRTSKYLAQFFCSSPFSNIKKSILANLKMPGTSFLLIPFFKYQKKHTYESQNTWHNFFAHPLFQIL